MSLLDLIHSSYQDIGEAKADAALRVGQIWGQAAQTLGQLPQQIQQQKTQDLQNQVTQAQLDASKAAQAGQANANAIVAALPRSTPDGLYDTGALGQTFASKNVPTDVQERMLKSLDGINGVIRTQRQSQIDHLADIANSVLTAHGPDDPITPQAVQVGLAQARALNLVTDDDVTKINGLLQQGADPEKLLKTVRAAGSKFSGPQKFESAAPGSTIFNAGTGQTVATTPGGQKTEAELAADASNPSSPTALQSKSALALLKGAKPQDEWAAFQQATAQKILGRPDATFADLSPEQQVKAVTDFKTIGPEASAAAAADRQTATIGAQVAQQKRAQDFTETQTGKKANSAIRSENCPLQP